MKYFMIYCRTYGSPFVHCMHIASEAQLADLDYVSRIRHTVSYPFDRFFRELLMSVVEIGRKP